MEELSKLPRRTRSKPSVIDEIIGTQASNLKIIDDIAHTKQILVKLSKRIDAIEAWITRCESSDEETSTCGCKEPPKAAEQPPTVISENQHVDSREQMPMRGSGIWKFI